MQQTFPQQNFRFFRSYDYMLEQLANLPVIHNRMTLTYVARKFSCKFMTNGTNLLERPQLTCAPIQRSRI